jgi:hypothetical protein
VLCEHPLLMERRRSPRHADVDEELLKHVRYPL